MKLAEVRDVYQEASETLSDLVRKVSFAGIAVVWIFRVERDGGSVVLEGGLLWALGLFTVALALDLLQYVYKSVAWALLNRKYWRLAGDNEYEVPVSSKMNVLTWFFFLGKTAACVLGYALLFVLIFERIAA